MNEEKPLWRSFTVFELSGNMTIGLDQSLLHFDRCLLKFGNGDLPIAKLPDSIHIPPENRSKMQDESGIGIRESLRNFAETILTDIDAIFHAQKQ